MTLSEIKTFLKWRKQASLDDFVRGFDLDRDQIQTILEQLVAEGALHKHYVSSCCNDGCEPCVPTLVEYYEMAE
ncbi:MAG: FeoC-like transcriptional regulator [Sedimenticola sp.]